MKGPHINGHSKRLFNHHFLLVYGTKGTPEENIWAFAKARYDRGDLVVIEARFG